MLTNFERLPQSSLRMQNSRSWTSVTRCAGCQHGMSWQGCRSCDDMAIKIDPLGVPLLFLTPWIRGARKLRPLRPPRPCGRSGTKPI